jgi:nucleoside-diphosphate-sugar epimerase
VRRVLVTGASGFIGGAIRRRLAARDDIEAIASARSDLCDRAAIEAALSAWRPDVVVHAAGRTHGDADQLHADNVEVTRRLAEAMGAGSPLILLGSAAQYGRSADQIPWRESDACAPPDAYGASKLEAERAAFETGARVTALRIFNVVSPEPRGQQVFATFLRKAAAAYSDRTPWEVELAPLDAVRDFVALDDVLTAIERAIDRDVVGETINVCTGHGRTVRELVLDVARDLPQGEIKTKQGGAAPGLPWSVGDPARCCARLGFAPSPDLSALTVRAADWVKAQAKAGAHA